MPILLAAITIIIQACFIFHVFKTGRPYWWALIILSFPVIGCIVYYFIEIFPGTREARSAGKLAKSLGKKLNADADFRKKVEEVEICGSVDNKAALARECTQRGMHNEAVRLYQNCLQGLYADDPKLMYGLAEALVENSEYAAAREAIDALSTKHADFKTNEVQLLRARTLEGLGEYDAALRVYDELLAVYVGLEARARHGLLLKKLGRDEQARTALDNLLDHARRHNVTHDAEQHWVRLAKKELNA